MIGFISAVALLCHSAVAPGQVSDAIDGSAWVYTSRLATSRERAYCAIGGTTFRIAGVEPQYGADSKLVIESDGKQFEREIPRSRFMTQVWATSPIACDAEAGRVFVASKLRGSVVAYSVYGDLLWQVEPPGFSSAHDDASVQGVAPSVVMDALAERHSILLTLDLLGEHVVVQFVTARRHFTQVVIHRSGTITRTIGPWEGVIEGVEDDRLSLVTDFEVAPRPGVDPARPKKRLVASITSEEGMLVEHFLGWLLPLPGDQEGYGWRQCESLPRSTISQRMGRAYDDKLAGEAKQRHDQLGVVWFNQIVNRGQMPNLIRNAQPQDREWTHRLRTELLRVGADVALWQRSSTTAQ